MSKKFYLTTPLYYVNGVPHVGHLYTTVIADAIARYKRMNGFEVCALTGTDEHGLKIERAALEVGLKPQELADRYSKAFQVAWKRFGLNFDEWIRTTEKRHFKAVRQLFQKIEQNGFTYLGEYSGFYCVSCEAYVPEDAETCPDCGRQTEFMTEKSYFFKLSAFEEKLLNFFDDNPDFVIPATRMNEIVSFVKGGLRDFSISRTSFKWGIPVPSDPQHIFYVWFDALTGYLSGIGYGSDDAAFQERWPADVQLIGKDILRFHAVYWPAMLMAAGLEPPRHVLSNGWWTVNGQKMSKSKGNFITADDLADILPADYIKYFLIREIPIGGDGDFSLRAVVQRVNSDLANDIGNLTSRTLKMIETYFDGRIPQKGDVEGGAGEMIRFSQETIELYRQNFDRLHISKALDNVWELISAANKYIVANEPWALAKEHSKRERLGTVLYCAAETVRVVAVLLGPIVPDGASAILRQLGVKKPLSKHGISDLSWGGLTAGGKIGKLKSVFPRLDPAKISIGSESAAEEETPPVETGGEEDASTTEDGLRISLDDFARVEMRVGRILSAEPVPRSSKLLKIQVDLGEEERQVVAGIAKAYRPDDLKGKLVAVVTNLEPAKLMGVESNGMIVAAAEGDRPVLVTFTEEVAPGTRLK